MRIAPTLLAVSLAAGLVGCHSEPQTDGDQPAVLAPDKGKTPPKDPPPVADKAPAKGDRVLAEVDGVKTLDSELLPVLYDAYGLDVLLKVVQRDMARAATAAAGITVSSADIDAERALTLAAAFPDQKPEDYDNLLTQFLGQQHVSRAEFAIVMDTNANLRALVKPAAIADISEDAIHNEFNAIYGERVHIKHIQLNNPQEVAEAQRRLAGTPANGVLPAIPPEPFEEVARRMSVNRVTGADGGDLPPFARTSGGYSPEFIQAAFALKPGEVSTDMLQEGQYFHIIKSVEHLAPKVVKYEDVHDSVREELIRKRQGTLMNMKRGEMAQRAIRSLDIKEPALRKQFADRLAAANPTPADRAEVKRSLDERLRELNAATQPATAPTIPQVIATPTTKP